MLSPPFKRTASPLACCAEGHATSADATPAAPQRTRLAQLEPQLHCSVIGTCLSTAELRKLMAPFIEVKGASDLDIHHEAVRLASRDADVAKALNKALDTRHAAALATFARLHDAQALAQAWDKAQSQGEIPGAYWAVMTHKQATTALRQQAFGDVHMLSHRVGSANRAGLQRLSALERENAELHDKLEREQQRRQELVGERDALAARLLLQQQQHAVELERQQAVEPAAADGPDTSLIVALHTERRERAEHAASQAWAEAERLQRELDHLRQHAQTLGQELSAAEAQLREWSAEPSETPRALHLQQRRILYVGGRPSSTPAIRDLVQRQGGEFLHHDGGIEARKGLLDAAVLKADLIVFPVDCIDHDSALKLKRLAERHGIPFTPLRSASVASFAAALSAAEDSKSAARFCLRHG